MKAREQLTLEEIKAEIPEKMAYAKKRFERLSRVADLPEDAIVLDIGSAQGLFVASCRLLGLNGFGIEPWEEARDKTAALAGLLEVPIDIAGGVAEKIPFQSSIFDLVHADSVMEHVIDIDAVVSEVFRVLKPGGIFWFHSTNALCPVQNEIEKFPLFGWYPDPLKKRIMNWAKVKRPELVGYTRFPAVHWFTPGMARRLLRKHGFEMIYDRWDVSAAGKVGGLRGRLLKVIASGKPAKYAADMIVHGSNYTAVKPG